VKEACWCEGGPNRTIKLSCFLSRHAQQIEASCDAPARYLHRAFDVRPRSDGLSAIFARHNGFIGRYLGCVQPTTAFRAFKGSVRISASITSPGTIAEHSL
jgi:hypothetical protein